MSNVNAQEGVGMGWHIPAEQVAAYASGRLGDPEAWSVETHITGCTACATRLGAALRGTDLAARIQNVRGQVLAQARSEAQARARVGSRPASSWSRAWRLLTAAPALRLPWIIAAVLVVACAAALSLVSGAGPEGADPVLLLVAPLLPLAGVAASYGPGMDPAYELTLATPYAGLRLLLLRTVTVLGITIPLLLAAAVFVPTGGVAAAAWLLPALALVLVTLALGSWVEHRLAAALAGVGWAAVVLAPRFLLIVPDGTYVFDPLAQLVWAAVAVLAAGLLVTRRRAYDRYNRMEGLT